MNHSEISSFIWGTADLLRSNYKQHEYGDIILPFTVMRRLDVVLEPTKQAVLDAAARKPPESLRDTALKQASGVGFYNTSEFTMTALLSDADGILENLSHYVTAFSPEVADIFEKFRIFAVIKSLDENDLLFEVVERFCDPRVDLSPASVSNADMGDIYEELIRRFSEASNETAGEHFSPRDGLRLATELLVVGEMDDLTQPNRIVKVCDDCLRCAARVACDAGDPDRGRPPVRPVLHRLRSSTKELQRFRTRRAQARCFRGCASVLISQEGKVQNQSTVYRCTAI